MTKGTSSFGKRRNKTHTLCCLCGWKARHLQKSTWARAATPPSARGSIAGVPRLNDKTRLEPVARGT
ncbi:60S ribosomal protein L37 [Myotis brandtii]|uniref:60S ribosomal protein L37 n=1 Tax=Myotis brandtii TaxID=109478 RepID=S7MU54_MYOBR|nr:60S ribosomal protein L37 [Myotis brandtii]